MNLSAKNERFWGEKPPSEEWLCEAGALLLDLLRRIGKSAFRVPLNLISYAILCRSIQSPVGGDQLSDTLWGQLADEE
jgi:hypothetical protein